MPSLLQMKDIFKLFHKCRSSDTNFIWLMIRALYIKMVYNKIILLHQRVKVKGIENIQTSSELQIGINGIGFMHNKDYTYLNISGELIFKGKYSIGRGCRLDIKGKMTVGTGGYINAKSTFIIMNDLKIGNNCIISWNCQFLDDDFHQINYEGKKENLRNGITIGNNVWIGCNVCVYKGSVIPDGCVVASNSIVRGVFKDKNLLLSGNPAKIIKENINWS